MQSEYPNACKHCHGSGSVPNAYSRSNDICPVCVENNKCPRCTKAVVLKPDEFDFCDYFHCSNCGWHEVDNCDTVTPPPITTKMVKCCPCENRTINGGCINCGDPSY